MEINRRQFLEIGTSTAVGIATGYTLVPIKVDLNKLTTEITGKNAGSAEEMQRLEQACSSAQDRQTCMENFTHDPLEKIEATFFSPVAEEAIARAVPSLILNTKEEKPNPVREVVLGNRSLGFTRREVLWGTAISLGFGAVHNITPKGIDTTIIPTSQTFGGAVYWILQRKLGIFANSFAHMANNFRYYFKV